MIPRGRARAPWRDPCATLPRVRWLIVLPFARPGLMGVDFGDELRQLGHEVRLFAYRRDNPLYKNTPTKAAYQLWILRRLERVCAALAARGRAGDQGRADHARARATRSRRVVGRVFVNFFPDNPLWMIPFECIEAYDVFFTKERYAHAQPAVGRAAQPALPADVLRAGPAPPGHADARRGRALRRCRSRWSAAATPTASASCASWPTTRCACGAAAGRSADDPAVRSRWPGGPVFGHDKLCVYAASTLSLNPHHPMNDIVGVNTRAFELAAAGGCQVADFKEDLATLFKPGEEVLVYRDLGELRRTLDFYLARPDEARAIGENARRRALAEHTLRHRVEEMLRDHRRAARPMTASLARQLVCIDCGATFPLGYRPRVREVPRPARARLRPRPAAPRRPLGAAAAAASGATRPMLPIDDPAHRRDARRGRHAAAGGARGWPPARRAPAAPEVRGRESDRHREGSLLGHGRRRRAAVRLRAPRRSCPPAMPAPRSPPTRRGPGCAR